MYSCAVCCMSMSLEYTYHAGLYNVFFHGLMCLFIGLGKTKMRTTCEQNADNVRTKYGQIFETRASASVSFFHK